MKIKIGVMGSSTMTKDRIVMDRTYQLGREIALSDCVLVNGATTGLPDEAARGCKEAGGFVLGISPAKDIKEHLTGYKLPIRYYDTIVFTGFGFNQRNILNIRSSDALIFLKGSFGTLNEFTNAYEDGKIIGVLSGLGGVSDYFDEIIKICDKKTGAVMVYNSDPKKLVMRLIKLIKSRQKK